jgi:hypothetical protein
MKQPRLFETSTNHHGYTSYKSNLDPISTETYQENLPRIIPAALRVLKAIRALPDLTSLGLAKALNVETINNVAPRITALRNAGYVRRNRKTKQGYTFLITKKGANYLQKTNVSLPPQCFVVK